MTQSALATFACIVFNIACSILIVLLNKWVYVNVGFPNITLTLVHFVVTGIGLKACNLCGVFKVKSAPLREMMPIAVTFCGFVVFTNLSLQSNTIGTYQVAKVMTTPVIVVIQHIFYGKRFSTPVTLTLIPITLGVIVVFFYDIQLNLIGTIYATLGVLVTSLYQIWVSEKQHTLQMDAMQLLYYQAPLSALILVVVVPFFEPVVDTLNKTWAPSDLGVVLGSAFVAFFVNLSIYWLLGNTSPLTYNMVGHLKFCLTLLGGYLLFREPLTFNQSMGILLTILGVSTYAHFKITEEKRSRRGLIS
ncbi:solute carrier family 35 member E3-like [Neocloeon triangulifer]|uniref:solute carrier family 35 member E3-like n=1 Tax=Neocloeon triangulifer TaxID=2078957 RepID=UPI00286F2AEF|nr:solute carrier family 35 member E3-like [Neocloeon triangulifer]